MASPPPPATPLVEQVALRDFRNHERSELELAHGLTVVHGANGAGKTNVLEGIYFGLIGRSCRTSNEREIVRMGASVTRVAVRTRDEAGVHLLEAGFEPSCPKRLRVDGTRVERLSDSPARPLVSVFLPDRLALVKGTPAIRRAHVDQLVEALWPARAGTRADYARALAQRNALIARVRAGLATAASLDAWDAELARHGAQLIADRRAAVGLLAPRFSDRCVELGLSEAAELSYRSRSSAEDAEGLRAELALRRGEDLARGFSAHGPHRDELELRHGGRTVRAYGSQGQQRAALLGLLFAERDALTDIGRPPLMLLDDVMSELDRERRLRLSALLRQGGQAVVTTTDAEHVPGAHDADVALALVEGGQASQDPALLPATP